MKTIKRIALAMAVVVAVLCTTSQARAYTNTVIGTVACYSTMTISLTVKTNCETSITTGDKYQVASTKMVNKDMLNLLAGPDFANTTWPAGAKLVAGWDVQWYGDILVVDSTGTNVLYDASAGGVNNFSFNICFEAGVKVGSFGQTNPGSEKFEGYNTGYFRFFDNHSPENYLHGTGSCTENFSLKWDASGYPTTWSDTETFSTCESGQILAGNTLATTSGTITLSGHGTGDPWYLANR